MWLKNITLLNFKNYATAELSFSKTVNVFVGNNGAGKTNLLDAIHYLCLCKGYFNPIDSHQIKSNEDLFLVQGDFERKEKNEKITCGLKRNQKKQFKRNKKEYDKLANHIGLFPLVLIAPNDTDLIRDGSEERRRFFDGVLAQATPDYLNDFLQYNKILTQRNALLKLFAERNYLDEDLLETYNEPLIFLAIRIYEHRRSFMDRFLPLFRKYYQFLSSGKEEVDVLYESEVASADFKTEFRKNRGKDLHAQRTGKGIHKDEYVFEIDGITLKKFGSQGQQKSFVIALKLAQFELLKIEKEKTPILLLDDIFDKLDDRRIHKLIDLIDTGFLGQVFITDARPERSQRILENVKADVRFFEIER